MRSAVANEPKGLSDDELYKKLKNKPANVIIEKVLDLSGLLTVDIKDLQRTLNNRALSPACHPEEIFMFISPSDSLGRRKMLEAVVQSLTT